MVKSEGLTHELGRIKLAYADHFPGRISSMCNLATVVKAVKRNLTKTIVTSIQGRHIWAFLGVTKLSVQWRNFAECVA